MDFREELYRISEALNEARKGALNCPKDSERYWNEVSDCRECILRILISLEDDHR